MQKKKDCEAGETCKEKIDYLKNVTAEWRNSSNPSKSYKWHLVLRDWIEAGHAAYTCVPCFFEYKEFASLYENVQETLHLNYHDWSAIWTDNATTDAIIFLGKIKEKEEDFIPQFNDVLHSFLVGGQQGYEVWQEAHDLIKKDLPPDYHLNADEVQRVTQTVTNVVRDLEPFFNNLSALDKTLIKNRYDEDYIGPDFPYAV